MKKFIRGFGYAFKGLRYAATTQLNFRVHLLATVIAIAMGFIFHINTNEWLWISLAITLVISAELLNTAIEVLTDLVAPNYHHKAGYIKDAAAAAVLVTAIFALVTALIIFLPKVLLLIHAA